MGKSWREWNKHKFEFHKDGDVVLRRENRKKNRTFGHCCKGHNYYDRIEYDQLRDLREGKREHVKQIDKAIKGGYAHETSN